MNEVDFAKMESRLGITLPSTYRTIMSREGGTLINLAEDSADAYLQKFDPIGVIFLTATALIESNLSGRRNRDMNATFPNWHHKYVMIGTNNAGDYFCLRLDGKPGVWMIGTDCGSKPSKTSRTFKEFVADVVGDYRFELDRAKKAVARPYLSMASWKNLKEVAPKFEELCESYSEWNYEMSGGNTIAVAVTSGQFVKWCTAQGRELRMDSLQAFANECLELQRHKRNKAAGRIG